MKKYVPVWMMLATCLILAYKAAAQTDTLPYLKNTGMPALVFLNLDSTEFNTFHIEEGTYSVWIYFSPTCEHCEWLTQEIIRHLDSFSKTEFYMISPVDLSVTRAFDKKYNITGQPKMHLYKDAQHLFATYYGVRFLPFMVIYDKKKQLIKTAEGGMKIDELIELTHP